MCVVEREPPDLGVGLMGEYVLGVCSGEPGFTQARDTMNAHHAMFGEKIGEALELLSSTENRRC